jgi:hypothetical protein
VAARLQPEYRFVWHGNSFAGSTVRALDQGLARRRSMMPRLGCHCVTFIAGQSPQAGDQFRICPVPLACAQHSLVCDTGGAFLRSHRI